MANILVFIADWCHTWCHGKCHIRGGMARGDGFSIIKRKRNGRELQNYEVRVQVPLPWRSAVGKKEVLRSLGTGDRRVAARLAPQVVADLYSEWQQIAGGVPEPSLADPKADITRLAFDSMLSAMDAGRKAWPTDDAEYATMLVKREADLRRMARRLQDQDLEQWEAIADRAIANRGVAVAKGSDEYTSIVQAIAEATIDAVGVFVRRTGGELEAGPQSTAVREAKAKHAAKAKPGESIMELFELWSAEALDKGEKRPDTVNQDRKAIQQFASFVGTDRAIDSIAPLEVAEYRGILRDLPPKWMSKKELRGLDMRAAAAKAREKDMPRTAFTTVNKHLSTISPLYSWLIPQPKWAGLRNPVDGLFYTKVKGKNARPPFSTATLNRILTSPLFTGFLAEGSEHVPGNVLADDWRKWIPLVCLFTGARLGEIAQLRIGDVNKQCGVWFVHIREDEKEGLKTKSRKSRFAAVHPVLERIGFLAFHQLRLEGAGSLDAPLFPELGPNARGQISGTPSRWWRDYLEAIGVKDGADGLGAHSFRHTLADRLREEAELLDNEVGVCLGHSVKTTTSGYGRLPQGTANMLNGWMEAVRFDGVDFSHLLVEDDVQRMVSQPVSL